jgi:hypothetical protein
MRRIVFTSLIFLAGLEIYSIFPLRVPSEKGPEKTLEKKIDVPFLVGALHVPLRGDPVSTADALAGEAARKGLDFLVLSNLDAKLPDSLAGEHHGVDIFTEMEASTPAGHAVYFYSHTPDAALSAAELKTQAWRHYNGLSATPGAFLIVAHPSSPTVPWGRLDRSAEGIELFNVRSLIETSAVEAPMGFLTTLLVAPFNAYLSSLRLSAPNLRDLRGWDAVNTLSPGHFAVVATDELADWPGVGDVLGNRSPPIAMATNVLFPTAALSPDFPTRRKQIYSTLRQGKSALLFQAIHPFQGNGWSLVCGETAFRSGASVPFSSGCEFRISTPSSLSLPRIIKLVRDGETVHSISSSQTEERFTLEKPGAYRVEVWVKQTTLLGFLLGAEVPYVFYNPLYVR